jgi:hypothetical protein
MEPEGEYFIYKGLPLYTIMNLLDLLRTSSKIYAFQIYIACHMFCPFHLHLICFRILHDNKKLLSSSLGRAMAQAVIHRPLTVEARVRSRISPCGICGGQSGTGTSSPPPPPPRVLRFLPVNLIPPVLLYTEKTNNLHHRVAQ